MKKSTPLSFVLLVLLSTSLLSQSDDSKNQNIKIGLGLDLEFANFDSYPNFPPTNIILSIKPINSLRIEPGIGFYTEKSESDTNGEDSNYRRTKLGLGGYWVISTKKISPYIGLYFDYSRLNYDYDGNTTNESGYTLRLGPAIGLEYIISENFSIGGDFLILNKHEKFDFDYPDEYRGYKTTGWATASKLLFRFYF